MQKILTVLAIALFASVSVRSQNNATGKDSVFQQRKNTDSIAKAIKDSLLWARIDSTGYFPLINGGKYSKVFPVKGIDEIPDSQHRYKLLFELSAFKEDSTHELINEGLTEIARVINLHIAAGIPLSKIDPVVISHASALKDLASDSVYKSKNKKDNPNTKLIDELMKDGVRFIACGQALLFIDMKKEELHKGIRVALTAQVALSDYQGRGYVKYNISNDR